jgi:hypothetical protein
MSEQLIDKVVTEDRYNRATWNQLLQHDYDECEIAALRGTYRVAKRNAGKRGIDFNLSPADFVRLVIRSKRHCMVSGIAFDFRHGESTRRPWMPSLDRVHSNKGYTNRNCRLVCTAINFAMNEWGVDVLNRIGENFVQLGRFPHQLTGMDYFTVREFCELRGVEVKSRLRSLIYTRAASLRIKYGEQERRKDRHAEAFPLYLLDEAHQLALETLLSLNKRPPVKAEFFPSDGLLLIGG